MKKRMHFASRGGMIALIMALLACLAVNVSGQGQGASALTPRKPAEKPRHSVVGIGDPMRIEVKFVDGLRFDVNPAGKLIEKAGRGLKHEETRTALLSIEHDGGSWQRLAGLSEALLDQKRDTAERRLRRQLADLNSYYILSVPEGINPEQWMDLLNGLSEIEIARSMPRPAPLPVPGNFQPQQGYLNAATGGIDASSYAWTLSGGTGANVRIVDVEYSWNLSHLDLPAITTLVPPGQTAVDPYNSTDHGTAVLGELASLNNGWGTTGIAYGAQIFVAPSNFSSGYNPAAAITNALGTLTAGDIILIEQQTGGPHHTNPNSQAGLVPMEWWKAVYDAIVLAVGNGIHVIEAAGNGSEDLDHADYSIGNGGHYPFNGSINSGAIIVGGGAAPGGSDTDRSRLGFSNWGTRVNLQGWGEAVMTTGYGTFYNAEGQNLWYRSNFAGTSSASPIVAGAAALLESIEEALHSGTPVAPGTMRSTLIATGSPQQAGTFPLSQNIGPRPRIRNALLSLDPCNLTCPANILVSNTPGQCGAIVNFPAPTASGSCGAVTCVPASGTFFPVGITNVVATTLSGSSCSFTVTVRDTQPPTVVTPANITIGNSAGQCSAVATFTATATDNCPGVTISCTPASGSVFPLGTTVVTCTAVDANGNSTSRTFTVTVIDVIPPAVVCPANIQVSNAPGLCSAVVTYTASATDNCPGVVVSAAPASGSTFPVGATTVTVTALDAHGNSAVCTFTVTVVDNQPPVISAPVALNLVNDPGQCGRAKSNIVLGNPVTSDNCGVTSITNNAPTFFPVGLTPVTWTAMDARGNTASAVQNVTIRDTEKPAIFAPPMVTVDANPTMCGRISPFTLGTATATDNCTIVTVTNNAPGFWPVGTTIVTWTATDQYGNVNSATQQVIVRDVTPPVVTPVLFPQYLYPVNRTMRTVTASVNLLDNCPGSRFVLSSVTSSEADAGTCPGDLPGDISAAIGTAATQFALRAERSPTGLGRTYTVRYTGIDASNNQAIATRYVYVAWNFLKDDEMVFSDESVIPDSPALEQNYPNPFSGSTSLVFRLPEQANAVLTVHDGLGREVARLAEGSFNPGSHAVTFRTNDLPNGVYFARLTFGSRVMQIKMLLLRN